MAELLNILFSNTFGQISSVPEGTFMRTIVDPTEEWLLLVEFSSAPYHGFTPTHDRGRQSV